MKRITIPVIATMMAAFVSTFGLTQEARADDCVALGGALVAGECQVTTAVARTGTYNLDETLRVTGTGRIDASGGGITINVCVAPATPGSCDMILETPNPIVAPPAFGGGQIEANDVSGNDNASNITISVSKDIRMQSSTAILAQNNVSGGHGGNITMTAGRNLILNPDAMISVSASGSSGNSPAGNIAINVGDTINHTEGIFTADAGSRILANSVGASAGQISINAGLEMHFDGLVQSFSTLTGTGANQAPGGGPITVVSGCLLMVHDNGVISSEGRDPGADLVHLEGCEVTIWGLVESKAPGGGHVLPNNPANHCNLDTVAHPNGPSDGYTACVEIWGNNIVIDHTGTHNGQVNADGIRATMRAWIDVLARKNITLTGPTSGNFLVHANAATTGPTSGAHGGLVNIKSEIGKIVATQGLVVQANGPSNVQSGGDIFIQAGGASPNGQVDLGPSTVEAIGTAGHPGSINVRSFNDSISGAAAGVLNALNGAVNLTACNGITYAGTITGSLTTTNLVCGGGPTFPTVANWKTGQNWSTFSSVRANCDTNFCGVTCNIGGQKFNDQNGNGAKDPGEPGVPQFLMHLFDKATLGNNYHVNTLTDVNGNFLYSVPPGEYILCEQGGPPSQTFPTSDGSGGLCAPHVGVAGSRGYDITVAVGATCDSTGNDFGNNFGSTITGHKFNDLTGNGVQDPGDPPVQGLQIHLFNQAGTPVYHQHQLTNVNGDYQFDNVPPGDYYVCEQGGPAPNAPQQTFPAADQTGGACATHVGVNGSRGYAFPVAANSTITAKDFGNFFGGQINGQKKFDLNGDGNINGDPPWTTDNVNIHLVDKATFGQIFHVILPLPPSGSFSFSNVPPGEYYLCEEPLLPSIVQTFPTVDGSNGACEAHLGIAGLRGYDITMPTNGNFTGQDFGNFIQPTLTVNKVLVPANDSGLFNLQIDGSTAGTGANVGNGGTTGAQAVTVGAHSVGETAGTGTSLGNYTTVIGGDCAPNGSVTLAAGDNKVCTITNTRTPPSLPGLRVDKVLIPPSDPGLFNLQIDGLTAGTGTNVGNGGTTGTQTVTVGAHTAGETAGTGTNLGDYTSVIGGDCAPNGSVTVNEGETKVCTITNTRKPRLTVNKILVPANDTGLFNLQIDGSTAGTGANVGNGGTTGTQTVTVGAHSVGETAGTGTSLGDYTTVIGGDCAANGSVTVNAGESKVCTITNTRKPRLTVNKILVPANDTGLFNLQIDGSTAGTGANVGNGGTTGTQFVTVGSHTVGETAGTGTSLGDYTTVIGGDCAANGSVTLAAGDNKVCTITNTRKPRLTVNKILAPANDPGLFNLQIDGSTAGTGANVGNGGTTGTQFVTVGSHSVGETAGTGTSLGDYTTVIGGDCAANGSVTLAAGDNKVCTITNTRKPPPTVGLRVDKVLIPANDPGLFNLQIDGSTAGTGANVGNGGTTGTQAVAVGAHTVGETAGTGTSLSDYITVIGGDCAPDGSVTVNAGENKVCTITNTRKPRLTVNKILDPANDPGKFNLQIDGSTAGTGANVGNGGTTGAQVVAIGVHSVGETAGTGTNLANYVAQIGGDCAPNGSVTLAAGDNKVCVITNRPVPPPPPPPSGIPTLGDHALLVLAALLAVLGAGAATRRGGRFRG